MRMTNARDILGRSGKLYDVDRLGNQVGSPRPDNVDAKNSVRACVGNDLDQAIELVEATRPAVGGEGKLANAIFLPELFDLFFGQSYRGHLRPGVNHPGDRVVIDVSFLSRQTLGEGDALLLGLMGQHGTGN